MPNLVFAFILIPLIDLILLIKVSGAIGGMQTILLVIITGIIGANLARSQGLHVLKEIQKDVQKGSIPTDNLLSGLLVLIGGVLLITPGILTDIVGLSLMIPAVRKLFTKPIRSLVASHMKIVVRSPFMGGGMDSGFSTGIPEMKQRQTPQQEPREVESRVIDDDKIES